MAESYVKEQMGKKDGLIPLTADQFKDFFGNKLPDNFQEGSGGYVLPVRLPDSVMDSIFENLSEEEKTKIANAKHRCGAIKCLVIDNLSICKGCRKVYYCSTYHQRQEWPEHKKVCNFVK